MNLENKTIAQMSDAEKTAFIDAMKSGNVEAAGEIVKASMMQAVEKEARMAANLLKNPRNLSAFAGVVLDMTNTQTGAAQ